MIKKPKIEFKTWIRWYVLANQTEASLYRTTRETKFKFIERFHNQAGRKHERDLDSDGPGKSFSSASPSTIHHSLDRSFHHHEFAAKQFAKTVAQRLDHAASEGLYTELVLVCEPQFLGLLRAEISDRVRKLISHEVNREYSNGSDQEMHSLILKAMEEMPRESRA
jgi:protein required for attachment to host cells